MGIAALCGVPIAAVGVVGGVVGVRAPEGDTHHHIAGAVPNKGLVKLDLKPACRRNPVTGVHQCQGVVRSPVAGSRKIVVRAVPHIGTDVGHRGCARRIVETDRGDQGTRWNSRCRELGGPVNLLGPGIGTAIAHRSTRGTSRGSFTVSRAKSGSKLRLHRKWHKCQKHQNKT